MATVYLGMTREYFWGSIPAEFFAIVEQWNRIEYNRDRQRAIFTAMAMSGQPIPDLAIDEDEEVEMSSFFI